MQAILIIDAYVTCPWCAMDIHVPVVDKRAKDLVNEKDSCVACGYVVYTNDVKQDVLEELGGIPGYRYIGLIGASGVLACMLVYMAIVHFFP